MFASIFAFSKENKILTTVVAVLFLPILVALLLIVWIFIARIDFGYPGGEINFLGMARNDVLAFVANKCERTSNGEIILSIPMGNQSTCSLFKYYSTLNKIYSDENIMKSRYLGVNYRSRLMSFYQQELEFGSNNIVVRQKVSRYCDGP